MRKLLSILTVALLAIPASAGEYTYNFVAADISQTTVTPGYVWVNVTKASSAVTGSATTTTFDNGLKDTPSCIIKAVVPDTGSWANDLDDAVTNGESLAGIEISNSVETVGVGESLDVYAKLFTVSNGSKEKKINDHGGSGVTTATFGSDSDTWDMSNLTLSDVASGDLNWIAFRFTIDKDRDVYDIKYDNLRITIHTD